MSKPIENPIVEFGNALQAYGLVVSQVNDDGALHKCKCAHDKGKKTSGRYFLHSDGKANGKFGCYHDHDNALGCTWESNTPDVRTDAEKAAAKQQYAIQAAKREAQSQAERDEAAIECKRLWGMAHDANSAHAYLANKGVQAYGLKSLNGALLVPVYDGKNTIENLTSIQFIQPDGSKQFKTGGKKQGCYFSFGSTDTQTVVICEGYSTGASIAQATGHHVVVAFDAGNLKPVSRRIHEALPDGWTMVIAADNDAYGLDNKGLSQATAAAQSTGALLALPCFDGMDVSTTPTDFNDLHQLAGLEAVKAAFAPENLSKPVIENLTKAHIEATPTEETATPYKPTSHNQADGVPDGFIVNDGGVWYAPRGKGAIRVCDRLDVVAMTSNENHQECGKLLKWRDTRGRNHKLSLPVRLLYGIGSELQAELASRGLRSPPTNQAAHKLKAYIEGCTPSTEALCTDKTGWHNGGFVLPDQTIGQATETAIYQSTDSVINPYSRGGTLEGWRDGIASLCVGNSLFAFSVSMAFAGVLLPFTSVEGGGVHIVGDSSTGKSTATKMAASVYGESGDNAKRRYWQSWRATDNGLEGVASTYNHSLLILDEVRQAPAKTLGDALYMLRNGTGKARAGRSGGAAKVKTWQGLYLSNGEITIAQRMMEAGVSIHAGQEVRFAEIKADAGKGYGAFEQLHGHASGESLSEHMKTVALSEYGTAGIAFIEACARLAPVLRERLAAAISQFSENVTPKDSQGQVRRVAGRFGLIAAAGELASELGITGWAQGEATRAAEVCFNNWLDSRESGSANSEESKMLKAVQTFIMKHGDSRFTNLDEIRDEKIINRAGWKQRGSDGGIEYFIISEVFKEEVCAGLNYLSVVKYLAAQGMLKTATSKNKISYTVPKRIDGGTPRLFCIKGSILSSDADKKADSGGNLLQLLHPDNNGKTKSCNSQTLIKTGLKEGVTTVTTVTPKISDIRKINENDGNGVADDWRTDYDKAAENPKLSATLYTNDGGEKWTA